MYYGWSFAFNMAPDFKFLYLAGVHLVAFDMACDLKIFKVGEVIWMPIWNTLVFLIGAFLR